MTDINDEIRLVDNLFRYWFNVAPTTIFNEIYGEDRHPSYQKEKVALILEGPHALWSQLDTQHRARMLEVANAKYQKKVVDLGSEFPIGGAYHKNVYDYDHPV